MKRISTIQNFTEVITEKPLDLILTEIRTGFYREAIFNLRRHIHYEELGHYENYKKALTTFTPSGIFKWDGKQFLLQQYSQYILLDTGRISQTHLFNAEKKLRTDPHVLAAFKSPSACSLKIIVEVNTAFAYHREAFLQLKDYFEKLLSLQISEAARDISQLCFISFDPALYQNPNPQIFQIQIPNF